MKLKGWLLLGFVTMFMNGSVSAATADDYARALEAWARVLERYVDDEGRTDFIALAENSADLKQVVDVVAEFGPNSNPESFSSRDAVLAYHANSYNALAMYGVIDEGIPAGFNSFFKRAGFFKFRKVRIDGGNTNLYDYENRVIRPLGEPRIHFALNCMVRDCPRLPQQPFPAEGLDDVLEAASWEFFSKPRHLQLDHDKKRVNVSAILDFYTEDFVPSGRARDLGGYINRYLKQPLPTDYKIGFIKYDWTINQQPRTD
ncbi:MAG: DUF547 domain-containing protein [Pseudomonadota bacterium]